MHWRDELGGIGEVHPKLFCVCLGDAEAAEDVL